MFMKEVPIAKTAEEAALSLIVSDPDIFSALPWDASLFALEPNRTIFDAIARVHQRTGVCSAIQAICELETSGRLEFCGGTPAVMEVFKTSLYGPGAIAQSVASDYRRQLAKAKGFRDAIAAWTESEPDIRRMNCDLAEISEKIARAAAGNVVEEKTIKHHLTELIDDLEQKTAIETFSTGIPALDRHFHGGLLRGEMLVVGADTGGGKSILLYQAALQALEAGKRVAIFSLEMPAKAILRRMAANMIGKRVEGIREMTGDQRHVASGFDLSNAFARLMNYPLTIHDTISEVAEIDAESHRLVAMGKADLIVVDYLQIVTMPKADSREQAISELARRLKLTALKTNSVVLTASQLNEEGRLRESRAIGHHADAVINIRHDGSPIIVIDKNRRGQRGATVPVVMRGDISRFEEDQNQ
jgi:replicative DNA helicase